MDTKDYLCHSQYPNPMKKLSLILTLPFCGLFSCKAAYTDLSVVEFENKLAGDGTIQLVDVRTPEEYAEGHLPGAININWYNSTFLDQVKAVLSADRPVAVYCRSGKRSAAAAARLETAGFRVFNLLGGYMAWTEAGKSVSRYEVERFITDSGKAVDITLIKHGSLEIRHAGRSIQVDPVAEYGKHTDYAAEFPKADVILVTHEHPDHFEPGTIRTLTGDATRVILNGTCRERLGGGEIMANGENAELFGGILLEAVPAYNTTPGREKFHPKGNGNGYVLTIDGLRIYIAGDTEDVPEMAQLKDIDVAFLPVNQPYTMTLEQCIRAARLIAPKVLIPYHYSATDLSDIPAALPGIDVRIRQMQ